jgi:hypothetical protein
MSDFLDSLVDHSLGAENTLRPLVPSRFEPLRTVPMFHPWDGGDPSEVELPQSGAERPSVDAEPRDPAASPGWQQRVDSNSSRSDVSKVPSNWEDQTVRPSQLNLMQPPSSPSVGVASHTDSEVDNGDWLHRRLDELASQMHRLRGDIVSPERAPVANPRSAATHDVSPRRGVPVVAEPTHDHASSLRSFSNESSPSTRELNRVAQLRTPPVFDQPLSAAESAGPDLSPLDRRLSRLENSSATPPPQIVAEPSLSTSPKHEVPIFEEPSPPTVDNSFQFDQFENLLSQLGKSAMQPPPRIIPEDLSSLSRRTAEPTINVTIGRVEVKAVRESAPVAQAPRSVPGPAVMTLDDYLKRRASGGVG